jgi:hypothetical protein
MTRRVARLVALAWFTSLIGSADAQPGHTPTVTGSVVAPDGSPAVGAVVAASTLQSLRASSTTSVDRDGRFRLSLPAGAWHQLVITRSDVTPHRVNVLVPGAALDLPRIELLPASYYQARFVTPAREPLPSPRMIHQFVDAAGAQLPVAIVAVTPETRSDGATILGPLPFGRLLLALDAPPFARLRLSDVDVNEAGAVFDAGTIVVDTGAVLNVDVVDEAGTAVTDHDVMIEEVAVRPLLATRRARTDGNGRASFDRLGEGRYRVGTRTNGRCGSAHLWVSRVVAVSGKRTMLTRLVVGGTAAVRLSSPFGPLAGVTVDVSPETGRPAAPAMATARAPVTSIVGDAACRGTTDSDGRLTLRTFPPGPARVRLPGPNSTYVRRISVPSDGREIPLLVPDGFLQVRVVDARDKRGIGNASIAWTGGGADVEARTVASGDAILEGVTALSGRLTVTASRYTTAELHLSDVSAVPVEVPLTLAPDTTLRIRVVGMDGRPLSGALLVLDSFTPGQVGYRALTDDNGMFTLGNAPPGMLQLTTRSEGADDVTTTLAPERRGDVTIVMKRR